MTRRPFISTQRAVEIYREMVWWRRELCEDTEFFNVPDTWETLCEDIETWKMNAYQAEGQKPKAAMVVFGDHATLTVDERLVEKARKGCGLSNSILAHEISHLALDHHAQSATTKHFQLSKGPKGFAVKPPNSEELEADLGAVFFQCGVALEDKSLSALELARRGSADVALVRNAQRYVQLHVFQEELSRQRNRYERVVM